METNIEKKGPELHTPGTTTAFRIGDSTPIDVTRQGVPSENRTNVRLDNHLNHTWPEVELHPYYEIQDMIEWSLPMLDRAGRQTSKRSCLSKLKTAATYLKRIHNLLSVFAGRSGMSRLQDARGCLEEAFLFLNNAAGEGECLTVQEVREFITLTPASDSELTLQELRAVAEYAARWLKEAMQMVADIIVADEDARYSGYRNAEGGLIVGGLSK